MKNNAASVSPGRTGSDRPSVQGRLLRGYLHKTSNSLCGIKGYASLIADEEIVHRSPEYWARKIISEVERMEEIFRSVGDLTGTRRIPDLEVSLRAVVHEVALQCQRNFPELDIFFGPIPEGHLLLPAVDLAVLLQEIFKNSAEAARPGQTRIQVVLTGEETPAGRIALKISDDGKGVPDNLIGQVADPFITTKSGHLGIGLSRVETLLDMYHLDWSLTSEPGGGTTVILETADLKDQDRIS
jgi:two-component system CheB/CheR fusion protein